MQIAHPAMIMPQITTLQPNNFNSSAKPCTCRGKTSPGNPAISPTDMNLNTQAPVSFNIIPPFCAPQTPIMSPHGGASNLMYLGKDVNKLNNNNNINTGGSMTCYNFPAADTPTQHANNFILHGANADLGGVMSAGMTPGCGGANRMWRSQDFLDQFGGCENKENPVAAASTNMSHQQPSCVSTNCSFNSGGVPPPHGAVQFTGVPTFFNTSHRGWTQQVVKSILTD